MLPLFLLLSQAPAVPVPCLLGFSLSPGLYRFCRVPVAIRPGPGNLSKAGSGAIPYLLTLTQVLFPAEGTQHERVLESFNLYFRSPSGITPPLNPPVTGSSVQFFKGYLLKSRYWTPSPPSWAVQKGASILPSTVVAPSQMSLPSAQEGMCVS